MMLAIMILTGTYLAVMAVIDRRLKRIPVLPGVICLIVVILGQIIHGTVWHQWLPGVLIGVFLYVVSKATHGAVGEGDALVYLLTGVSLGFFRNLELLVCSLFLASIVSGFLLVFRRVGRKYRIPFLPFTAVAYGVVMLV